MSWCPNDSSYLITCAKDNRTICWDTNSAEVCHSCFRLMVLLSNLLYLFWLLRMWVTRWKTYGTSSRNELELWCPLVSKDTRGYFGIHFRWKKLVFYSFCHYITKQEIYLKHAKVLYSGFCNFFCWYYYWLNTQEVKNNKLWWSFFPFYQLSVSW